MGEVAKSVASTMSVAREFKVCCKKNKFFRGKRVGAGRWLLLTVMYLEYRNTLDNITKSLETRGSKLMGLMITNSCLIDTKNNPVQI